MDPDRNAGKGEVTKLRGAAAVVLTLLLVTGAAWYLRPRRHVEAGGRGAPAHSLPAGGEIFAIDTNIVTEIDYERAPHKLVARRPGGSSDRFSIEVTTGSDIVERCEAGGSFAGILEELSSIHARRALDASEASALKSSHARDLATLRIVDDTAIDPQEFGVLLTEDRQRAVVLVDGESAYESTVPRSLFERLAAGCSGLAERRD
jgi:hypothetical protein